MCCCFSKEFYKSIIKITMYHPSRGGVRGGSDQFSWDAVKADKHRENYLGHSLMAPIGRWQKGKDLSWYSKERTCGDEIHEKKKRLATIKKAEEDAMLAALGFKSVEREVQHLAKEEMADVLRRNVTEQDNESSERIQGVGIGSGRASMLMNGSRQKRGMMFESGPASCRYLKKRHEDQSTVGESSKSKSYKKTKKEKKDKHKKSRKHKKHLSDFEYCTDMKRHKSKHRHH